LEHAVSNAALDSKSFKTTPWSGAADVLRELIAAMPIVILAGAIRAAVRRPAALRPTLRVAESN